jgi:hypothetical protein
LFDRNGDDGVNIVDKLKQLIFRYDDISSEREEELDQHMGHFTMESGGLREENISFKDPFECFEKVGGFGLHVVARLTHGTNRYFHKTIKPTLCRNLRWHKIRWTDVTIEEMYHFLGILLKISLTPIDGGGYKTYFMKTNKVIFVGGDTTPLEIKNSTGFASEFMQLERFQQIRGAFHPEDKSSGLGGDKCYQIRHIINVLNASSKKSFKIPRDLSFDEGGVGCRSRYCPVRQYNKDKPQKFRVDFFICADSKNYFILHLDVYQGKNAANIGIHDSIVDLPTTQKAVANALHALGLHLSTDGMRHISMDNRYMCP